MTVFRLRLTKIITQKNRPSAPSMIRAGKESTCAPNDAAGTPKAIGQSGAPVDFTPPDRDARDFRIAAIAMTGIATLGPKLLTISGSSSNEEPVPMMPLSAPEDRDQRHKEIITHCLSSFSTAKHAS